MELREAELERDFWPLTRFCIVILSVALVSCQLNGWQLQCSAIWSLGGRFLAILFGLAMVSYTLAHLYLVALCLPVVAMIRFNDWFYDFSEWFARKIAGVENRRALAVLGLLGEMLLLSATFYGGKLMVSRLVGLL